MIAVNALVVDTSVVIAVIEQEADGPEFERKLDEADRVFIGAPTVVEALMVLNGRRGNAQQVVTDFLAAFGVEIVAFDARQVDIAFAAFLQFGKGRHRAALNFGDCLAYASAKSTNLPLLFKGNDFSATDLDTAPNVENGR